MWSTQTVLPVIRQKTYCKGDTTFPYSVSSYSLLGTTYIRVRSPVFQLWLVFIEWPQSVLPVIRQKTYCKGDTTFPYSVSSYSLLGTTYIRVRSPVFQLWLVFIEWPQLVLAAKKIKWETLVLIFLKKKITRVKE